MIGQIIVICVGIYIASIFLTALLYGFLGVYADDPTKEETVVMLTPIINTLAVLIMVSKYSYKGIKDLI